MSMGPFATMTYLDEFTRLQRDWRLYEETRIRKELTSAILNDDDATAARRVAHAGGALEILKSFDQFIENQIRAESGPPAPTLKEPQHGMHPLRRR